MKVNNPNYLNGLTVSAEQINAAVEGGGAGLTPEQAATLGKIDGLNSSASEIDNIVANYADYTSSINNIYISTMYYTKNFRTANIVAKVLATKTGDKEITVTTLSDVSNYSTVYNYSIVIKYTNGIYKSYIIDSTNTATGVIILDSLLENYTVDSFMMMHDSNGGQHLSEYGYAGLAQYVFNELQNEKKINRVLWKMNPYELSSSGAYNNPDIKDSVGNVYIDASFLGGTTGGGYVANTSNKLFTSIGLVSLNPDMSASQQKRYQIQAGTLGHGVSFPVTLGINGYIELGIGLSYEVNYTTDDLVKHYIRGIAKVELLDSNNNVLFTKSITGGLQKILIPISDTTLTGKLNFTCGADEPVSFSISEIIIWEGEIVTSSLKSKNVGFIGDSWTQYPSSSTDYPSKLLKPYDGTLAEGYQFISRKMEDYSLFKSEMISTRNYGRGGQTSEWGKAWTKLLKNNSLDYGVILFFTNDANSATTYTSGTSTVYDFSPSSPYVSMLYSAGGVFGSVSNSLYLTNLQNIKTQINGMGAKAVILSPAHTSGMPQTSSHMALNGLFIQNFY